MTWSTVIVGVNGTEESVRAACAASMIASSAGVDCVPVFAAPNYARLLGVYGIVDHGWLIDDALNTDRLLIRTSLKGKVPDAVMNNLVIETGRASPALARLAHERKAGLIALGSRPRRGLDRVGHDTARHLLRTVDVPLLIAGAGTASIRRIIAAVDASSAARPTIEEALRWRDMFGAELRVLHACESLPEFAGIQNMKTRVDVAQCEDRLLELDIMPLARAAGVQCVARRGSATAVIRREVSRWKADLLVVGSHGRGFVDRLLLGSTTERLLRRTPTLMLVLPLGKRSENDSLEIESLPWETATV